MAKTHSKVGIRLEGETLRYFEQLVSHGLATLEIDRSHDGQPYALITKGPRGTRIVVHAQAFKAAEDNVINTTQVFIAAEDGTPL